jgi:Ser/Thr protein kinase RdoA (MazF antagonist)
MVNGPDLQVTLQGSLGTWPEYIVLRLPEHLDVCSRIGAANHQETRRIEATFESAMNLLASFTPALLHGDLGSHNIFSDGTNITALIDWEDSLSGDPVFEIAFWATFHPERRHAAFLDGYRSVCPLPDDFDLRFWLYFLRIALAKTVLRHRLGIPDRPGRSPAAARIQRGLHRVESLLARERRGFSPSPRRSAA